MSEFNSKGTTLSVANVPAGSTQPSYKKLYGLFTVPEMGGTPEHIDVTNLEDSIKRNILGIQDTGTLDFEFYANATADGDDTAEQVRDTWGILRSHQTAGTLLMWKLEYPDGEGFTWKGKCSLRRQSVGVNSAIKFTLTVGLDSPLEDL